MVAALQKIIILLYKSVEPLRKAFKKIVAGMSVNGGVSTPCPQLNKYFFLKEEKDAECSETKPYFFSVSAKKNRLKRGRMRGF